MLDFENEIIRSKVESNEKWREWCKKIKPLKFDSKINVTIIPPFAGALTRFVCDYNNKSVSVYFDGYSKLGYMYEGEEAIPYYEAYPINGCSPRYLLGEEDLLMADIKRELGISE